MTRPRARTPTAMLLFALLAGCAAPQDKPAATANKDEEAVRAAFTALQEALKAKDAGKLWALLDEDSQADAERAAQAVREAYGKAAAGEKAEQEKALGLPGAELAALKGQGFLKTARFHGKYDEIPDSKVEKVAVQGDTAAVSYVEPDGDKEKLAFVRQGGKWKVTLPMPKGS